MIELESLTKDFGSFRAVDALSFNVAQGEVLGFLGPNGAGKSTTMRMVTGFLTPTQGTARLCGFDIQADPVAAKQKIGYLPEGAPAWPDMPVQSFLTFIAQARGVDRSTWSKAIGRAVEQTNLNTVLKQPIGTLSKGFKRRVGLAQALLHDPEILIMDEPTDGLDPNQKHEVRALIKEMADEKAIIISTHILEEVEAVCSRAVVIAGGKIVADETPAALEARSPYHNSVSISVSGEIEVARAALATLPEVKSVELGAEPNMLFCQSNEQRPMANQIAARLREQGISFDAMHVERGRLDDVFLAITDPAKRELNGSDQNLKTEEAA